MNDIVLFGAGEMGKKAACYFFIKKRKVMFFIDNDVTKWETFVMGIPVLGLEEYLRINHNNMDLFLCLNPTNQNQVENQLKQKGYYNYQIFNVENIFFGKRIISYASQKNLEDVILYHVLRNESEIFYIDVGSSDPFSGSVTKLLYDAKNASGINIDARAECIEYCREERPRDINLCMAIGSEKIKKSFYFQGGLSTFVKENVKNFSCPMKEMEITTLKEVCNLYMKKDMTFSFLKIDVEGYEREVLEGADFDTYRPSIIVVESTVPCTMIPVYEKWENIIIEHEYHYVFSCGVNRYYIADERKDLDDEFFPEKEYYQYFYNIVHPKIV